MNLDHKGVFFFFFFLNHVWSKLIMTLTDNGVFPPFLPRCGDFLCKKLKTVKLDT